MKNKIPKYCATCGNKLEQEKFIHSYSEQTGKPSYRIQVKCQNCHDEGTMVYFFQSWKVESNLKGKKK